MQREVILFRHRPPVGALTRAQARSLRRRAARWLKHAEAALEVLGADAAVREQLRRFADDLRPSDQRGSP